MPLLPIYFLYRGLRNSDYFATVRERLGLLPRSCRQTVSGAIWLHAASAGEVAAISELARRLRADLPHTPLLVSTATLAGKAAAVRVPATAAFHAPVDYVFAIRSVLRTLRPSLLVVAETEIWPNLLREAKRWGCGVVIVNGRISDRTAQRYHALRWFFGPVLSLPDRIFAQSEAMRERYILAGAPPPRVETAGNLKHDFVPPQTNVVLDRPRRVWIAASTMAADLDEDDAVIEAYQRLTTKFPDLLLILAPRKTGRFDIVARKLERTGIAFTRRSRGNPELRQCLLLDTIGELAGLFRMADVVFMGGTLAATGGHNILEPAFFGRPIVIGPHMENFREIAEEFKAAGACLQIANPGELAGAVDCLLEHPGAMGRRALACAGTKRGATTRCLEEIRRLHAGALPCFRHSVPALAVLWPLSRIWLYGGKWKAARDLRRRRRLDTPVVSIGNITMGGTGKTPFVIWLAARLNRPAILTRGYGRQEIESALVLEPGAQARTGITGDEPQIILRSGVAVLGISADRYTAGRLIEQRGGAEIFILDDGFQHRRLERQLDIVLIDGLNPFGDCRIFPLGRLREPMEALGRADIFVITRSSAAGIQSKLREYNRCAPIFHARVVPECWVEHATGRELGPRELPFGRFSAFCGLGNPQSFWSTLRDLDIHTVSCEAFNDHHAYKPWELRVLRKHSRSAQAEAILTTEKDTMNLCDGAGELLAPLPLYWLRIRMEVDEEAELLGAIRQVSVSGRK